MESAAMSAGTGLGLFRHVVRNEKLFRRVAERESRQG